MGYRGYMGGMGRSFSHAFPFYPIPRFGPDFGLPFGHIAGQGQVGTNVGNSKHRKGWFRGATSLGRQQMPSVRPDAIALTGWRRSVPGDMADLDGPSDSRCRGTARRRRTRRQGIAPAFGPAVI